MLPSRRPSSSQSPTESRDRVRDRDRELGHEYEHEEHDRRSLKRSRRDSLSPPVLSAHSHGGTSLPSIHHLHPDLPPAGQQRHTAHTQYGPSEFLPGPSYASRPFFPPGQAAAASTAYPHPYDERRLFERPLPGPSSLPASSEQRMSPGAESDQDQNESERLGPPKKKRRRQALSCTG
ncbi:hypothetical protein EW145_g4507 [Phellinidium pouzarii]|uniref:Uncharacterized protein n=1 Tax=Phellinidium pouzarii TaxID=167371 RepID=A0A4V3XCH2_9AGAM|nr:hypothetical protein EW145_g4507 [Phellinidium pouzarii]